MIHPPMTKESHRVQCTVPGCSHTFASVEVNCTVNE